MYQAQSGLVGRVIFPVVAASPLRQHWQRGELILTTHRNPRPPWEQYQKKRKIPGGRKSTQSLDTIGTRTLPTVGRVCVCAPPKSCFHMVGLSES